MKIKNAKDRKVFPGMVQININPVSSESLQVCSFSFFVSFLSGVAITNQRRDTAGSVPSLANVGHCERGSLLGYTNTMKAI